MIPLSVPARPEPSALPLAAALPLVEMPLGSRVRIAALRGGREMGRRLLGLGLRVGSEVEILHRRGGGVVVSTGENRIALGAGVAERILAEPLGE
jgi:ferrous iron transport protein A